MTLTRDALNPRDLYLRARSRAFRPISNRLLERAGLRRIEDTEPEDVFIVGYPKSGNTWFQNLASGIVFGVDASRAPDALIQELVPGVHELAYYKRFHSPTVFNSHALPRPDYRRVVYLLRDGRDAMVSYFHHLQATEPNRYSLLEMVRDGAGLFPCKWHHHVEAWRANPYQAEIIEIRYEDLKQDPVRELGRFCEFNGISRTVEELTQVAEQCSFQRMRRKEVEQGWSNAKWPKDKPFIRRGQIGSYRDEMSPEALQIFMSNAGEVLSRCGYP